MKVIGVTGNSGSGKSYVSKIIKQLYNAELIDADKVARKLLETKTEYYKEIVNEFGKEILDESGICRKKLAEIVYNNKSKLEKLNLITNKWVVKEIKQEIKNSNNNLVIIDVPLLFESNLDKECDITIAILSNLENKIKRICTRDNISSEIAHKRLSIQPNDTFYKERTKYIIENNNNEEELKKEIIDVLKLGGIRSGMQNL